jgi:hypothetical protein
VPSRRRAVLMTGAFGASLALLELSRRPREFAARTGPFRGLHEPSAPSAPSGTNQTTSARSRTSPAPIRASRAPLRPCTSCPTPESGYPQVCWQRSTMLEGATPSAWWHRSRMGSGWGCGCGPTCGGVFGAACRPSGRDCARGGTGSCGAGRTRGTGRSVGAVVRGRSRGVVARLSEGCSVFAVWRGRSGSIRTRAERCEGAVAGSRVGVGGVDLAGTTGWPRAPCGRSSARGEAGVTGVQPVTLSRTRHRRTSG